MYRKNLQDLEADQFRKSHEGANALNEIRRRIFSVFTGVTIGRLTKEEAIKQARSLANNAIQNGTVTEDQIEDMIAVAAKNSVKDETKGSARGR